MKFSQLLLTILVSVAAAAATAGYMASKQSSNGEQENAYRRVAQTNILRCGYAYWDGSIMRDNQSGALYGPWVDIVNEVGAATGLKIEWTEQVGWDEVGAALKSHKIDAMCAGMWTSANKSREIAFSTPFAYQAIEAFVRAGDTRFDNGPASLDKADVKLAVIDNDNSDFIAQQDFPHAQRVALGQINGTDADLLMYVMTGKSDAAFTVTGLWRQFDKANPGKMKRLWPNDKLRVFGLTLAVDANEPHLLQMLNAAEQEVQNSGKLAKILDKANQQWPDMYLKPVNGF